MAVVFCPRNQALTPREEPFHGEVLFGRKAISRVRKQITDLLSDARVPKASSVLDYFLVLAGLHQHCPLIVAIWRGRRLKGILFGRQRRWFGFSGVTHLDCGQGEYSWISRDEESHNGFALALQTLLSARRVHSVSAMMTVPLREPFLTVAKALPGVSVETSFCIGRSTLILRPSYEEYLRSLGPRTRETLRRYRRKAAAVRWRFEPALDASALDAAVHYLVDRQRTSRHSRASLRELVASVAAQGQGTFCGLFTPEGEPISVVIGWREGATANLVAQLNHNGARYERANISTVMRSCLIEDLIARGVGELTVVAGCRGLFEQSCRPDPGQAVVLRKVGWTSRAYRQAQGFRSRWREMKGSSLPA